MDTLNDKDNDEFDDVSEKNDEMDTLSDKDDDEFFFYRNNFFNFDQKSDEDSDESSDGSSEKTDDENDETNEDLSISGIVK